MTARRQANILLNRYLDTNDYYREQISSHRTRSTPLVLKVANSVFKGDWACCRCWACCRQGVQGLAFYTVLMPVPDTSKFSLYGLCSPPTWQ